MISIVFGRLLSIEDESEAAQFNNGDGGWLKINANETVTLGGSFMADGASSSSMILLVKLKTFAIKDKQLH